MERIFQFLEEAGTFYLATDDNGQPRVRPFGAVALYQGKLYIHTGRKKDCYRQMKANPRVEICAMKDGEWIRITAKVAESQDIEAEKYMLDNHPDLKNAYQAGDGNNVVFSLEDGQATISSFSKDPVVIRF